MAAKKVLFSVGGGKVKESLVSVDDTTGAVVIPAPGGANIGLTIQGGGMSVTGLATLSGGASLGGNIAMGTNKITGLGAPTAGTAEAATALYVDNAVAAVAFNQKTFTIDNSGGGIIKGMLVALDASAGLIPATAATDGGSQVIGVVTNTPTTTGTDSVIVQNDGFALTNTNTSSMSVNAVVYLSTGGGVSVNPPTTNGYNIVIVGYVAVAATVGTAALWHQIRPFGVVTA
jgi:hypothetical protein